MPVFSKRSVFNIKITGFGIEGFGGAEPGDLNVVIEVVPDPTIESFNP